MTSYIERVIDAYIGDTLTDIAHSYGEAYWYPANDGLIYQNGDE